MTVTVYGLASSEDGIIRYIGQTVQPANSRLRQHIWEATRRKGLNGKSRRVWNWIASVLKKDHNISAIILNPDSVLHETEMNFIKEYRENGYDLINATDGGEGTVGYKLHMKRPWVSEMNRSRAGIKTKPLSEEHKAKVSAGNKGKKHPWLVERNKLLTGKPGRPQTDEERAKRSATLKGRVFTPEWKAKISAKAKGRKVSPETTRKRVEGLQRYHQQRREAKIASC
jgi:hypothetical protein